jgi:tape measure domain-containing protein
MSLNVGELYATLGLDTKPFDKGLERSGGGLSKLVSVGKKVAIAAGGAVSAFGGAALLTGYKRLTSIQDATQSITVQLGSAKKAAELMNNVLAVAKGTPFSFDQFASATRTLVAMSVPAEKIPGYLRAFGEAAAASGQGAAGLDMISQSMGKMAATGQVALDDVWSLSNAGVPALQILANGFGTTRDGMKNMISEGAVPAGKALDILTKGIMQGSDGAAGRTNKLAGTMKALGKTTSGSLSNAKAAVARFGATALQPVFDRLPGVLQAASAGLDRLGKIVGPALAGFLGSAKVADFVDRLRTGVEGLAKSQGLRTFLGTLGDLGRNLARLASTFLPPLLADMRKLAVVVGGVVYTAIRGLNAVIGPLSRHGDVLVPILEGLVAGFVAMKVVLGVQRMFLALSKGVAALNAAMAANPAVFIAGALVALGVGLYMAYKHIKPFHDAVDKVGRVLRDTVWPAIKNVAKAVGGALVKAWDAIKGPMSTALGVITDLGKGFLTYLVEPIKTAVGVIVDLFHGDFAGAFDLITALPGKLIAGFGDLPGQLLGILGKIPGLILDLLKGAGSLLLDVGGKILSGLLAGLTQGLPWLAGFMLGLPIRITEFLGDAGLWLIEKGAKAIAGLVKGAWDALPGMLGFIRSIPGRILDGLKTMYSVVTSVGTNLIHGIWHGASAAFGWLKDNLASLPGKVFDALKGMYELMGRVGTNIVHGIWHGIVGAIGWLKDKISGVGGAIVHGFQAAVDGHSPARKLYPVGRSITQGVGVGMVQAIDSVTRASQQVAAAAVPVVAGPGYSASAGAARGTAGGMAGAAGGHVTGVAMNGPITFASELDIDQVMRRAEFAVAAERF